MKALFLASALLFTAAATWAQGVSAPATKETPEQEIQRLKAQVKELQDFIMEPNAEAIHYKELWQRMKVVADSATTKAKDWEKNAKEWEAEALRLRALLEARSTPAPAVVSMSPRLPGAASSSTTTLSGSGGVYTTNGGKAMSTTIIETAPGHFEIRLPDGTTQRVIKTTP